MRNTLLVVISSVTLLCGLEGCQMNGIGIPARDGGTPVGGNGGASGAKATGGGTALGGSRATGGATAVGGTTPIGGATDGVTGQGGASASAGATSSGGIAMTGGVTAAGGTGGRVVTGGTTAGGTTASGGTPACPADVSQITGWPCTEGLTCEYGTDPRPSCRDSATCTNGSWTESAARCVALPPVTCPSL